MSTSNSPTAWFWRRVDASLETSAESLGLFRIAYCLYVLLLDAPCFSWIDQVPSAFFEPPILSPAYLFSTFPPAPFFKLLDTLELVGVACVAVGFRTRLATAVVLGLNLLGENFQFSFGKLDHPLAMNALLLCMLIANWGRACSVDALLGKAARTPSAVRRERQGLGLLAVILCLAMLTSGTPKLLHWVDFDLRRNGFLAWYYPARFAIGRDYLLAFLVPHTPVIFFEAGDYFAALFELLAFAGLLVSARHWRLWLATATSFHLLTTLTLNIPFSGQVAAYTAFVAWDKSLPGADRLVAALRRARPLALLGAVVGVVTLVHVGARWLTGVGYSVFLVRGLESPLGLYLAVPFTACALALIARDLIRLKRRARQDSERLRLAS